ncbi:MAG TPA: hypothetical protein VKB72_07020 [Steroidobacteraceae bacterium]|nr:hypothetical protein [Steroidobacteraceae bacterium]
MIAGHFGFAAMVKARVREAPLWALMLASVWLDVVFVPLYLTGIETIARAPGTQGIYAAAIIHANYTHSLGGAALLAAIFGWVGAMAWGRRTGLVLGLVVLSHWVLDVVVHRADLPLLPGNAGHFALLGFGLWRWPMAAAMVELALVIVGGWLYWRAARAVSLAAQRSERFATLTGALVLIGGVAVLAFDVTGVLG